VGVSTPWPDDEGAPAGHRDGDPTPLPALPPLPPLPPGLVVPDDPRDLEADAEALRAERSTPSSPPAWQRVLMTRRWRRSGLSGPVVVLALFVVAAFASLVVAVLPSVPRPVPAAPLASPLTPPGRAGGLLPDLQLPGVGGDQPLRSIRPGVVLLVPDGCECRQVVADLVVATRDARLQVLVVGRTTHPVLPETAPRTRVGATMDDGRLSAALSPAPGDAPTAVLVRPDGVIARVAVNLRDVQADIGPDLAVLSAG